MKNRRTFLKTLGTLAAATPLVALCRTSEADTLCHVTEAEPGKAAAAEAIKKYVTVSHDERNWHPKDLDYDLRYRKEARRVARSRGCYWPEAFADLCRSMGVPITEIDNYAVSMSTKEVTRTPKGITFGDEWKWECHD